MGGATAISPPVKSKNNAKMKTNYKKLFGTVMLALFFTAVAVAGTYAPAPKFPGDTNSTAIYYTHIPDSNDLITWATEVVVERGYKDISHPELGFVTHGLESDATGPTDLTSYGVVSLGDGGVATLTFDESIYITNGNGNDFAVFENGISDTFLELGFVEVSSDGINFFGFDAVSLTPTNKQIGGFGTLDTTNIHNLAGKYKIGYGTPFDLEELKDVSDLLDVNSVTHIRIIDVVGFVEPADFYGDGVVNFIDFGIFAAAYMSEDNDDNWNQDCDISDSADGIIDLEDLYVFIGKWLDVNDYSSCDINGHQINDLWPTAFQNPYIYTYTGGFDLDAVGIINTKSRE